MEILYNMIHQECQHLNNNLNRRFDQLNSIDEIDFLGILQANQVPLNPEAIQQQHLDFIKKYRSGRDRSSSSLINPFFSSS